MTKFSDWFKQFLIDQTAIAEQNDRFLGIDTTDRVGYDAPLDERFRRGVNVMVEIQYMATNGNWTTVMVVQNIGININNAMAQVSKMYPGKRVRAIEQGRLIDIIS